MTSSIHVAVGPELPDFGSWQWLGQGIVEGLKPPFTVEKFADPEKPPAADIVVYIKFLPPANRLVEIAREARIVYLPVDVHGTCNEIDECFESTRSLSLVLVNCMRLLRYYRGYCPVEYVDHPLKFALASPRLTTEDGPWIWIGRQCNIAPIVQWANSFSLRRDLWVLTNFEGDCSSANSLGFRSENVKVERWCEQKHMHYLNVASVAVDIKGTDFRARHKPPAKALDFLASGIPLITNRGSSADLHLGTLGFRPIYDDSWQLELGDEHRKSTMEFGAKLQSTLSRRSVLGHLSELLKAACASATSFREVRL